MSEDIVLRSSEIVDPSGNNTRRRRRTLLQVGGPILSVVLVVAVIIGVSLHTYFANRDGVLSLTRKMFSIQADEVSLRVSDYLGPAPATAIVAHDLLAAEQLDTRPMVYQTYARSMLRNVSQVESFFFADDTGAFWYVGRAPEGLPEGYETSHIETRDGEKVLHHWYYDEAGKLTKENVTPLKEADPRKRAWYVQPQELGHLFWSDPYGFKETGQFVVTASTPMTFHDGRKGAFAINISLNRMTDFLEKIHLGNSGRAVIIDKNGRLVAGSGLMKIVNAANWNFQNMKITPQNAPVFYQALAKYHVYGAGPQIVDAQNKHYVTISAPLAHGKQRGWVVMLEAQESDFSAFTRAAGLQNLAFSALIVVLAAALAGFLVRQNRKTERVRRVLEAEREKREADSRILSDIAGEPDLFDADAEVPVLTRNLAACGDAKRVTLWRFVEGGQRILCEDSYDREADTHSAGIEIARGEIDALIAANEVNEFLMFEDAAADERSRPFSRLWMRSYGSRKLLVLPVNARGRVSGMMTVEDAQQEKPARVIGTFVAGIAAVRFNFAGDERPEGDKAAVPQDADVETRFGKKLVFAPDTDQEADLPAGRYPMVSAATIVFGLVQTPAIAEDVDLLPVVQRLAEQVQAIAREHRLFSMQAFSNRILLIGGCRKEGDRESAQRLADAMLAIRELCMLTLADAEFSTSFRIGMHVGPALGAELGGEPRVFNLWGEAIHFSELLAESMPDAAAIQVSEAAHVLLRENYLFRPRGDFYLPRSGVTRSFILAGRR